MKFYKKIIILLIFLLPLFTTVNAQENKNKKQKQIERTKEKRTEEAQKKYEKAVKRHHKIQGKDTRKQMKKALKTSKQQTPGYQKNNFFNRLFNRKKR